MSESSEFPSLFLSLSESENEEEKTDNNANILCNKEDRPMANCQVCNCYYNLKSELDLHDT